MSFAPVRLSEAADSLAKASTPEPFSSSKTSNWVARAGGLPDYIQHIAHDLMEKRGKSESNAIQMAVGIVKRWARGGGKVDSGTRAAAAKAVAEWEAKKASTHAKLHASEVPPAWATMAVERDALSRLVVLEQQFGLDGLIVLLAEASLQEAVASSSWKPKLVRTASASGEMERHEVHDGDQHVGTVTRRSGFRNEPDRYESRALNGERVTDFSENTKAGALEALRKHLEEAPARVGQHGNGKWLVAQPSSYSGPDTYKSFPTEAAARFAAGLPEQPSSPERGSQVQALGEMLRFDLMTVSGWDIPPLRRVQEARRRDPFELVEAFDPAETRDFRGRWRGGGGHHLKLTPRLVAARNTRAGRPKSDAQRRYEGGVVRASARARAAHAAKPQIATVADKRPELKLAASIGEGKWSRAGAAVSKRLMAQKQMSAGDIQKGVKAGTAIDTETAHRTGRNGTYSAERKALHEEIISKLLQGKGVHEGSARAIFTAGGGASGKSSMIRKGAVDVPHDAVLANPDVVREMLPEYKALKAAGREDAASLTHEEASHITKVLTRIALSRQHHILVDGVGDSGAGKFAGKIRDAQNAGHRVSVHYATIPTAEAIKRSDIRGAETGRYVDHGVLREAHRDVSARFGEVSKIRGIHLQVFDTTERTPRLIAEHHGRPDKIAIADRGAFRGFLSKANE